MQPDPKVFLIGAARELRRLLGGSAGRPAAEAASLQRIAAMLDRLALRMDVLPGLLGSLLGRQLMLLADTAALLKNSGMPLPPGTDALLACSAEPLRGSPEQTIAAYRSIAAMQASCIRILAPAKLLDPVLTSERHRLLRLARALEGDMLTGYAGQRAGQARDEAARPMPADDLGRAAPSAGDITSYLRRRFADLPHLMVTGIDQHRGVNTKDIMLVNISGHPDWPREVVMRRMRGFMVNPFTSVDYEFGLLEALGAAGLPVPLVLLRETGMSELGHPFLIMERHAGSALRLPALGDDGPSIAADMARCLAQIHRFDIRKTGNQPETGAALRARVLDHFDRYYRLWVETAYEPSSTLESAFVWLRENIGVLDGTTVLVHGDYDLRNILIDGGRISVILDWERSHIGHPAEDLAYCRGDAEHMMPWAEFLALYRGHGGQEIDDKAVAYFSVWGRVFRLCSITMAHHGYRTGLHQDFLLGSAGFLEYFEQAEELIHVLSHVDEKLSNVSAEW